MQISTLNAHPKFGTDPSRKTFLEMVGGLAGAVFVGTACAGLASPFLNENPDPRMNSPYDVVNKLEKTPSEQFTSLDIARLAKLLTHSPTEMGSSRNYRRRALKLMEEKVILNNTLPKNVLEASRRLVKAYGTDLDKSVKQNLQIGFEDLLIDTFYTALPDYMILRQAVQNQAMAAVRAKKKSSGQA